MTLCTVAIPVYNREHLVRAAIESALAQNAEDLEILVIDNCSTDRTWDVMNSYADPRLRRVRNETNIGLFGNLNRCLELAQGKYVRILCSDDRLTPDCLQREIEMMETHPHVGLLSTHCRKTDIDGNTIQIEANELKPGLYRGGDMIGLTLWFFANYFRNPLNYPSGILLRSAVVKQAGTFSTEFRQVGDLDYWLRMLNLSDAIIADHVGCEIISHAEQESSAVQSSGQFIEEFFTLAGRWETHLRQQKLYKGIRRQLAACALYMGLQFARKQRRDVAALYWRTATTKGYRLPILAYASCRFLAKTKLRHKLRVQHHPRVHCQPLHTPAAEKARRARFRLRPSS